MISLLSSMKTPALPRQDKKLPVHALPVGERWERRRWRIKRPERVAAVEKIEESRKPDDFFGYRNRELAKIFDF